MDEHLLPELWSLVLSYGHKSETLLWSLKLKQQTAKQLTKEELISAFSDAIQFKLDEILFALSTEFYVATSGCDTLAVFMGQRCFVPHPECDTMEVFVARGNLRYMQWAHIYLCLEKNSTYLCNVAARYNQLQALKWLIENGYQMKSWIINTAAHHGHLIMVKRLRYQYHCDWSEETCVSAARGGHLKLLQWLHKHHCPWNCFTLTTAMSYGMRIKNLELAKWVSSQGCPWTREVVDSVNLLLVSVNKNESYADWLREVVAKTSGSHQLSC